MFGTAKLGKLFGIDLFVHGTFWLLPLFVFVGGALAGDVAGAAFDVAVVTAIFGCVALHEVGHALAARYYRIGTRSITLYPVGGIARLDRMPERPAEEVVIALAGPAVNLMIAAGLYAGLYAGDLAFPGLLGSSRGADVADLFVERLFWGNVVLVGFNLLPAFPMDGGRVLRAVLSLGMSRVAATRAAVGVGVLMAAGFFLVGAGLVANPLTGEADRSLGLVLVAVVVYLLGQAELAAVRRQDAVRRRGQSDGEFETAGDRPPAERGGAFTGWAFDPGRRVWGLWRDGVLVREVPEA